MMFETKKHAKKKDAKKEDEKSEMKKAFEEAKPAEEAGPKAPIEAKKE